MSLRPWTWSPLRTLTDTLRRPARTRRRPQAHGPASPRGSGPGPGFAGEALESRRLLTTLQSGDVFEFIQRTSDQNETLMRLRVDGNAQVEVLGAFVSKRDNRARVTNMPGEIVRGGGAPIIIGGGIGGPGGIDIIGTTFSLATGNPDINSLAATADGTLYGFDIETIPIEDPPEGQPDFITRVWLVEIEFLATPPGPPYGTGPTNIVGVTATPVMELTGALSGQTFGPVVLSVAAADFNPINGLLYFVTRSGEDAIDQMFTLDVDAGPGSLQAIPGIFGDGGEDGVVVASIAFDQTGPGTAQLLAALGDDQGGDGGGGGGGGAEDQQPAIEASEARIVIVNQNNTNFLTDVFFNDPSTPEPDDITVGGLEVLNEDPNEIDSLLLIGGGVAYELVRNDPDPLINDGLLINLGGLSEPPVAPGRPALPDEWVPNAEGATGLTFHPTIIDPFTQSLGAYIGYDAATDQIFFVNRNEHGAEGGGGGGGGTQNVRTPFTIYQIYVTQSDGTGRIAIAEVPDYAANPRDMIPFSQGSVGVRHIDAQNPGNPPALVSTSGSNSGPLLIGAQTLDLNAQDPFDDLRILPEAIIPENISTGLLPPGDLPIDPRTGLPLVAPGITVNGDFDRFLLDGTVTGSVQALRPPQNGGPGTGSINQFFCGWLLTGEGFGEAQGLGPTRSQNFRVQGDLRDLYVADSIGTDSPQGSPEAPTYVTGFDLNVGGTLGSVRTGDMWLGNFTVANRPEEDAGRGIDVIQSEVEFRAANGGAQWDAFQFSGNPVFNNDTFDTPQHLGAIDNNGQANIVRVAGAVQHLRPGNVNDWVDYYGVALMAGQTVQAQLFGLPGLAYVGVFDPDGRLIATDASDVSAPAGLTGYGEQFTFTADRPGTYRFAVSLALNFGFFNAAVDPTNIEAPYQLDVLGVGDIAVGGVAAGTMHLDVGPQFTINASYNVESGDLGELRAAANLLSIDFSATSSATVRVSNGNLRSLDGNSIGRLDGNAFGAGVQVDVPSGSVGLVQARDPGGVLAFNASGAITGRPPIGGDYQVVSGAGLTYVELIADRGIGVLRAGTMSTNAPSILTANFDDQGEDGVIDLIDVQGDLGSIVAGGPWITTNTGGNVRYMRVGGDAFTDIEFGGGFGTPIRTLHEPGATVTLTDDSGATIELIPQAAREIPGATGTTIQPPDFLTVRSYGIRGSGGVVVMDVRASDTVTINAGGAFEDATAEIGRIIFEAGTTGPSVVFDPTVGGPINPDLTSVNGFAPVNPGTVGGFGDIEPRRARNPFIVFAPGVGTAGAINPLDPGGIPGDLEVVIQGNARTDVWDIVANDSADTADAKFSSIRNMTGGEMPNIRVVSVGELVSTGTIGIARSHVVPAMALNPLAYYNDESPGQQFPGLPGSGGAFNVGTYGDYYGTDRGQFPYIDVRTGVWITGQVGAGGNTAGTGAEPGNVMSIRADQGVGNIVVNGSIGELFANADGSREPGVFAGIRGIIWARGNPQAYAGARAGPSDAAGYTDPLADRGGDIWYADIGEGLAAGGSGSAIRAGIYAGRHIDHIFGENADIRGNIIAGDEFQAPRRQIVLPGAGDPRGRQERFARNFLDFPDSIRLIQLRNGSIINANIGVVGDTLATLEQSTRVTFPEFTETPNAPEYELGRVVVSGNGGIIGTSFQAADIGVVDVNGGFGIFTSSFLLAGEGRLGGVEADNYGVRNVLGNVGASMNFLVAHGDGSSVSTDAFRDTVRRSELDFSATGGADPLSGMRPNPLTDIHAYLGTSAAAKEVPGRTDTGILENVDFRGQRSLSNIRGQQIRSTSPDLLPSVLNFANTVGSLHVRDQINGLRMTTGKFGVFRPEGDVFNLDLTVANQIRDLLIKGDLAEGSVIRTQGRVGNMGSIRIHGRLDGDLLASGRIRRLFVGEGIRGTVASTSRRGNALNELIVGGDIAEGGLQIQGSIGRVVVAGNFGRTGTDFVVTGRLGSITITGDLFSNIRVGSRLGRLKVGGSIITGSIIEAQRIGSITVGGDVQPGVIFRATRPPRIRTGGQMLGTFEPLV